VKLFRWWLAIVLVAVNLRPVIASVPPLIDLIAADLRLSGAAAGLLTALPVVCMGLFAPIAVRAAGRLGAVRVLAAAVSLVVLGTALRGVGGVPGLYTGTAVAGVGIAVAGALLPSLVKARFPERVGPVTGVYTATLICGALLGSALTEPLRAALDLPWQAALAFWAVPAAVAFAVVAPLARLTPDRANSVPRLPWRSGGAWLVTVYMGLQSLLFYAALAWLAARYTSLGFDPATGGLLLGVFSGTQVISALGLPVLAHRYGDPRPWIALAAGVSAAALVAVALAPLALVPSLAPWLWAGVLGLGVGGQFALALTVITERAPTPADAAALSGMAFFVGYPLAALGPVVAGALRDLTGGYAVPFLFIASLAVATLVVGVRAARPPTRAAARPSARSSAHPSP
jgi:MFS transporter, CP family, cyanate transporter